MHTSRDCRRGKCRLCSRVKGVCGGGHWELFGYGAVVVWGLCLQVMSRVLFVVILWVCICVGQAQNMPYGLGFIGYPKGRNVERALGFSLTGTVSTSPNLAKEGARSATIITRPSGSRFS